MTRHLPIIILACAFLPLAGARIHQVQEESRTARIASDFLSAFNPDLSNGTAMA